MPARSRRLAALLLALQCAPAAGQREDTIRGRHPAPAVSRRQEVPAWAQHPLLGRCFRSAQAFVASAFGEQGEDDENLQIRLAAPFGDGSTWVVDHTPQTNYDWYLLEPGGKEELCLALFVPAASEVALAQKGRDRTAVSTSQASPGFPEKEIRFGRSAEERIFHPVECAEIRHHGKTPSRKAVRCAGFYD